MPGHANRCWSILAKMMAIGEDSSQGGCSLVDTGGTKRLGNTKTFQDGAEGGQEMEPKW